MGKCANGNTKRLPDLKKDLTDVWLYRKGKLIYSDWPAIDGGFKCQGISLKLKYSILSRLAKQIFTGN